MPELRFQLLGVGAMQSPRFRPAGLLVAYGRHRVAIDGGPGAEAGGRLDGWVVTDERSELIAEIRRRARHRSLEPSIASVHVGGCVVEPHPVVHTSHPTVGYLIEAPGRRAAWAPEFWTFPDWAAVSTCCSPTRPVGTARSVSRVASGAMLPRSTSVGRRSSVG